MENKKVVNVEKLAKAASGMAVLILNILLTIAAVAGCVAGGLMLEDGESSGLVLLIVGIIYLCLICPFLFGGLRVLKPNEALVLTLFGKYYGTLKGDGFFFVNPFVSAVNPAFNTTTATTTEKMAAPGIGVAVGTANINSLMINKKISLKSMTLSNEQQKINDLLGNPVIIGINVIWRVMNTAKAVFSVDNYKEYLSIQCDSALRNIIRLYPYDVSDGDNEKSLRGSSQEIADKLKDEIQEKVNVAGLEIIEARITHLSYAQEIAAIMLQRQQASAIVDARRMIVEGAVGMVEMALKKLNEEQIVNLDEERKAAMVSNLLVVLCGNRDAQPIVNSGSLY
ncbi:MAG: SPFH domain-containing protein [Oscillospiraceae bacterium]|jgi:regulator of protease activity HflC (stomatin/prohibitin superfamily)|nr:SPFH domain-containing protein [Oscillospiraceae bacterium]